MGKKRFAGTLSAPDHKTTSNKYANNLAAWIRGWDYGIEVICGDYEGSDVFEIWTCGGSQAKSNGRQMIGKVINGEFIRVQ